MHSASSRRRKRGSDSCEDAAAPPRAAVSHLKRSRCIANRMNSWWPTLGASLVSSAQPRFLLVPLGVPPPRVIDGSRGLLCLWFHRPAKTRSVFLLFRLEKASPGSLRLYRLTSLIHCSLYARWRTKGSLPYPGLCVFLAGKTIDLATEIATLSPSRRVSADCALQGR